MANGLLQKTRAGDTTASVFYLKTQAGWRETTHLEHSGSEGDPIEIASPRDRIAARIDEMQAKLQCCEQLFFWLRPKQAIHETGAQTKAHGGCCHQLVAGCLA